MERLERLTSRNEDCVSVNGHGLYHLTMTEVVQMADRLAAYEDTGLEPEAVETVKIALAAKHMVGLETLNNTPISRLVELAEADKDGRVVVLPCKGYSSIDIARDGVSYRPGHWNIYLTAYAHGQNTPSGLKVGLFDIGEVERAMEGAT